MTRFSAALILIVLSSAIGGAQQGSPAPGNQLDANQALFTVMAALNLGGYNADVDSPSNNPLRKQVRMALATRHGDSIDEIKKFVAEHHRRDANAELTEYISFALSLNGPPSFNWRVPENEIPPTIQDLRGLEVILPRFYQEAGIADLWKMAQPETDRIIGEYHDPVSKLILETTYYLRYPTSGYMGRHFQIFIDLLGPPNEVQTRNYKDDYFVVITPTQELPVQEIRYAYLHYLIDPLALRFDEALEKKRGMADYANSAPALDESYKNDYLLLTTTCFVKAIETRLVRGEAKRAEMVDQAFREGFVFVPAFAEGLAQYEKQPQAMRLYFPTLVNNIDLAKEEARLEHVEFTQHRTARTFKVTVAESAPELTGVEKTLEAADSLYLTRNLDDAKVKYLKVLQETTSPQLHARAYYGMARIAALQRDPEMADKLFRKTLELSPDPQTKSWTYVYLGKLSNAAGEKEEAVKYLKSALAVEGASPKAKSEAAKEIERMAADSTTRR